MDSTEKLLSIAGGSISDAQPLRGDLPDGDFGNEFLQVLQRKNGFYAFEAALHVFPSAREKCMPVHLWNSPNLWRDHYGNLLDDKVFFFAEDIFGSQFAVHNEIVYRFNAETGSLERHSRDVSEWSEKVLADYNADTGYPLAHSWQLEFGGLPSNCRLIPVVPFVLGGQYEVSNLIPVRSIHAMRYYGKLAQGLATHSDGESISFDPRVIRSLKYSEGM